jgi:hypothetical protein
MKEIGNFISRLSSRKFLLTVGGIIACTLYPESATAITTLIATFVAGEGAADVVSRYAVEKTKQADNKAASDKQLLAGDDDDELDTTQVVPGNVGGDFPL